MDPRFDLMALFVGGYGVYRHGSGGSWRVARAAIAVQCGVLAACASDSATSRSEAGSGTSADAGAEASGPAACAAAGGTCIALSPPDTCSRVGPPDCNPGQITRNWVCCLGSISTSCTDANVQMVQASNYDQSCKTSSDCVAVGVGDACNPCVLACPNAVISATAKAQYMSDVARTSGWADLQDPKFPGCGCGAWPIPCCVGGRCRADVVCAAVAPADDAEDASLEAADGAGD